ncbi:response regulator transcription factor [Flavitalea sp. BT771]|uniref:response regulator transcription factor n=1 Tax=Flavitalea sp. BT771 TaxID=3063329 RepID=UPI0026E44DC8|nr:response regulator transcription factor [Flavitalea sp. BT771]MDO6434237.1 response regulator transcription factor [Flavitalea sp. BT771]MDV6223137.1 response regulator transcription factor [Flavitalea sp. BT771]
MNNLKPSVALVDDHVLLRNGLANLIRSFGEYSVLFEAGNGNDLIRQLKSRLLPDIVLLDINMPDMDGYETALWLRRHYPEIKILALSMYDTDNSIIRMLKNGVKGYILKDTEPSELKMALESVINKGFYYSEMVTGKLIHTINALDVVNHKVHHVFTLNERELEFLRLACTECTYKEIAEQMYLSPRTIDGYRDTLFEKLNVKTRVGLVLYAIRNGIVAL